MAIKVKHEGNVTSRVYASAAGGKGKRQAEDARVLASMQRGGNGGGGGTGGGARAGGSAPTLSAPTSHAQLGSTGSLISPRNTFAQQKELQKQQDDAILARQKDEQKWKSGENQKEIDARAEQGRLAREARQKEVEDERAWKQAWKTAEDRLAREARQKEIEDERAWKEEQTRQEEMRRLQNTSWEERGFDAEQRMKLSELHRKRNSIVEDPKLRDNQTERDAALKDIDGQIDKIKPNNPRKDKQTIFNDSIVTDEPTGIRYRQDGRGNWIPMETTDATPDEARRKYIFDRIKELTAENAVVKFTLPDAIKQAGEEYDAVVGSQSTPTSTSAPTPTNGNAQPQPVNPPPADEEEKKNKWGSFAR